jgi:hypothetical protein
MQSYNRATVQRWRFANLLKSLRGFLDTAAGDEFGQIEDPRLQWTIDQLVFRCPPEVLPL